MELIHMVGGIDSVRCAEGAEHLSRQLHIDHVDHFVALLTEFSARNLHHYRIPLAGTCVSEHRRFEILVKGIVGHGAVCIGAVFKKFFSLHCQTSDRIVLIIPQITKNFNSGHTKQRSRAGFHPCVSVVYFDNESNGHLIKVQIPDHGKDYADRKEQKSCEQNAMIALLFQFRKLALTVLCIDLVLCSAHGDERQKNVSYNESDSYESSLSADEKHSGKQQHQNSRNGKTVR